MKHGVVVTERKRWNVKRIYNNGLIMQTYTRLPKKIRFRSKMVSDFNQHLCGGWFLSDIVDVNQAILDQLLLKRKPFGSVSALGTPTKQDVKAMESRLTKAGLQTRFHRDNSRWELLACHPIRVRDIGDLAALKEDYAKSLGPERGQEIQVQVDAYSAAHLAAFFDGWDSPPLPRWLTGLILGYPIENTISLMQSED